RREEPGVQGRFADHGRHRKGQGRSSPEGQRRQEEDSGRRRTARGRRRGRRKLSTLISNYNEHGWEAGLLERILMPPLSGAEVTVSGATGESANRKWC